VPASRSYDRSAADLRPVQIDPGFVRTADGSALYAQGETRIICTASVTTSVPRWMEGSGRGWVTAEYAMLPASTGQRKERDTKKGRQDGRGVEIQRLIGRSLRSIVDLQALGERSVYVDCDVLQADGGTRCASITGGYVALAAALMGAGLERTIVGKVAAISVGVVNGIAMLDLDYSEDSHADVDFNVVGTDAGTYVELQGTAEGVPFDRARVDSLLDLANAGLARLFEAQATALASVRR
jgi:ribonuclease PH